jgi:hypothetical protein
MTTPLTLTPSERDILYQSLLVRLTGINDIYTAIEDENWDVAGRLSCEFSDLLRLAQDLGWGSESREATLTAPPEVLRGALSRLRERAKTAENEELAEREELAAQGHQNQLLQDICTRHLSGLGRSDEDQEQEPA